jgi:di/tricarboxylate transporter
MQTVKARILGLVLTLLGIGLTYINWHQFLKDGTYSLKMAAFGPLVAVGGVFLIFFPSMSGKPNTAKEKIILLMVFVLGLAAGLVNWYLMDPGFFGR